MNPRSRRSNRLVVVALWVASSGACASGGPYTWVDDLPVQPARDPPGQGYMIQRGDVLSVKVWGQDSMSGHAKVRDDGCISLLFLNDVTAAGLTPAALAAQLQTRLKDYLTHPVVSVAVEEIKQLEIPVLGEVTHAGTYALAPGAGVLQALAAAGGLTDFAHSDRIFVLESASRSRRIRFRYQDLTSAEGRGPSFWLAPGDVVVVE